MTTTSRGYPLFTLDDNADFIAKINAVAQAANNDWATKPVTDWNTALLPGTYYGLGAANGPATATYHGIVTVAGSAVLQTLFRQSATVTDLSIWQRLYTGSVWTAWTRLARGGDTDWVDITNISSIYTDSVAQCRIRNSDLVVRGAFTRKSGSVTVGESVFGLPAGMFPTDTSLYRIPFQSNGTVSGFLSLSTAGIATVAQVSGATTVIVPAQTSIPMD